MTKWMREIAQEAKTAHTTVPKMTTTHLTRAVRQAPADVVRNIDTTAIRQHATSLRADGRREKAAMLLELAAVVDDARTPTGSETLFHEMALDHMTKAPATSDNRFPRFTRDSGTSAVKKLMDTHGMPAFVSDARSAAAPIFARNDVQQLARDLEAGGFRNTTTEGIPADQAKTVADLAVEVVRAVVQATVPVETRAVFAGLSAEIATREDGKAESCGRILFSDQLVLKGFGADMGGAGATPLERMVADVVNKSASGLASGGRLKGDMKTEYLRVFPVIGNDLTTVFRANGMRV